jgi:diguanylate cyclase (GGDEF)-like protein
MKRFFLLWGPLSILAILATSFQIDSLFEEQQAFILYALALTATAVLSIAFSRNRLLLMGILLGIPVFSSYFYWGWDRAFPLFIPAFATLLLLLPDRKVFSRSTLMTLAVLVVSLMITLNLTFYFLDGVNKLGFENGSPILVTLLMLTIALVITINKREVATSMFIGTLTSALLFQYSDPSPITWGVFPLMMLIAGLADSTYRMSFKDQLTKINGRQALMNQLTALTSNYSLAMVDIDHFKKFNDTYGHKAGDEVLTKVAGLLKKVRHGTSYRYGGEEFTIVFRRRGGESAAQLCDEIRDVIEKNPYMAKKKATKTQLKKGSKAYVEKAVPVTVSIGVADAQKVSGGWEAVMKKADDLLYKAKDSGRNKVVT